MTTPLSEEELKAQSFRLKCGISAANLSWESVSLDQRVVLIDAAAAFLPFAEEIKVLRELDKHQTQHICELQQQLQQAREVLEQEQRMCLTLSPPAQPAEGGANNG